MGGLSFDELVRFIGAPADDETLRAFCKKHRLRTTKMDRVPGEPRASFAGNDKLGVQLHFEDDRVVGFSLAEASGIDVHGVAFGADRAQMKRAWGKPVETGKFWDTFRLKLRPHDLRVNVNVVKDALCDVSVELWALQGERAKREKARIDGEEAGPARMIKKRAGTPDVASMVELLGRPIGDDDVKALVRALKLKGKAADGVLMNNDVLLGVDGDRLSMISVFVDWAGGLEHGMENGVSTRADVRRALGKPSVATESFDIFERDGLKRNVMYILGRVGGWSVERAAKSKTTNRKRAPARKR